MDKIEIFSDVLGFTKQTEVLLHGLGASALIRQFKKRNISTSELHKLSKEDFINLGANVHLAEQILTTLTLIKVNKNGLNLTQNRIKDYLEILNHSEQQLSLIQAYIAYCRLRLTKERINFFVEIDNKLSASAILCTAVTATVAEVKELEKAIHELDILISKESIKTSHYCTFYCTLIGAISLGITTLLYMNKK